MAGYSGTPLWKKLGIKHGQRLAIIEGPADYAELVAPLPEGATLVADLDDPSDFIHGFVTEREVLELHLPRWVSHLSKQGALWISWPKKASKVVTDVDSHVVRRAGLAAGLVDVKVCAVDATWSGLKFVFRLQDR